MYLLNPYHDVSSKVNIEYLHSTMYLLNHEAATEVAQSIRIYIPLCIY